MNILNSEIHENWPKIHTEKTVYTSNYANRDNALTGRGKMEKSDTFHIPRKNYVPQKILQ